MQLIQKRSEKVGAPPGTLAQDTARTETVSPRITVFRYNEQHGEESEIPFDAIDHYADSRDLVWINFDGIQQPESLRRVGERFGLHDLVLEDILNTDQRPKADDHDSHLFLVLKMIRYDHAQQDIDVEQVSMVLQKRRVLSFQQRRGDVFEPIRDRIRKGKGRVRRMGSDYLVYALMDAVVDNYFPVMERLGDSIESLENELLERPEEVSAGDIHALRRKVILLRRTIWPLRDMVSSLMRAETPWIKASTDPYLRDLYDHIMQVIENLEAYREMLSGMLDIYLSSQSNRLNEVMKVLTIISTVFIPLGFIAGLYGMNFKHMPELDYRYGYPAVIVVMLVIVGGFLFFFRKQKWI
jgi:magnesium transporter